MAILLSVTLDPGETSAEVTRAVSAVATYSNVNHALTTEPENP